MTREERGRGNVRSDGTMRRVRESEVGTFALSRAAAPHEGVLQQGPNLKRVFDAHQRRDLVAQSLGVERHQEVGVHEQPACDVDLKPHRTAEFVDRSRVEPYVRKYRPAVERVKVFAVHARRVEDVPPQYVDGGCHPRMNGHDCTDRVHPDVGQVLGDARLQVASENARSIPLIADVEVR